MVSLHHRWCKGGFTRAIFVATTIHNLGKIATTCRLESVQTDSRRQVVTIFCNDLSATTRLYVVNTVADRFARQNRVVNRDKNRMKNRACKPTLRLHEFTT